ncbi:MAG: TrkH family potassium uptake protein, partial [Actinomycetes bacterium]
MTNKSMVPQARDRRGPAAALADFVDRVARYRPARLALAAYTLVALFFTLLLTLPVASADNQPTA